MKRRLKRLLRSTNSSGALAEHRGLLRSANFPTHGVIAEHAIYSPPVAERERSNPPLARVTRPTRFAPLLRLPPYGSGSQQRTLVTRGQRQRASPLPSKPRLTPLPLDDRRRTPERPRHPLACVESRDGQIFNSPTASRHSRPCPGSMSTEHLATHDVLTESDQWVIGFGRCTGNSGVAKTVAGRVYTRDVAASFTLVERKACARGNTWRNGNPANGNARMLGIEPEARGGMVGGRGTNPARPILDLSSHFRGPASKNLGRPVLKKFDPPQNDAPRLSGGPAARWASCPLVRGLRRARTHQRPSGGLP